MEALILDEIMSKTFKSLQRHIHSNNGQLPRVLAVLVRNASKLAKLIHFFGYKKGIEASTNNFPSVEFKAFMDNTNISQNEKDDITIHGMCNLYIGAGKFLLVHPVYVGIKPSQLGSGSDEDVLFNVIHKGIDPSIVSDTLILLANIFKCTSITPAHVLRWAKENYKSSNIPGVLKITSYTNMAPLLDAHDIDKVLRNGWWDECSEGLLDNVRFMLGIAPPLQPGVPEIPAIHPSALPALKMLAFACSPTEVDDSDRENVCLGCCTYKACTTIDTCGHFLWCAECAVKNASMLKPKCPFCRCPGQLRLAV